VVVTVDEEVNLKTTATNVMQRSASLLGIILQQVGQKALGVENNFFHPYFLTFGLYSADSNIVGIYTEGNHTMTRLVLAITAVALLAIGCVTKQLSPEMAAYVADVKAQIPVFRVDPEDMPRVRARAEHWVAKFSTFGLGAVTDNTISSILYPSRHGPRPMNWLIEFHEDKDGPFVVVEHWGRYRSVIDRNDATRAKIAALFIRTGRFKPTILL
jgi:hypothetical protein